MCDNRELERLREQRDDAIERAVAAGHERDALSDVLFDTTMELAEATACLAKVLELCAESDAVFGPHGDHLAAADVRAAALGTEDV